VGQRKRINVGSPIPLYVVRVDAAQNTIVVGGDVDLMSQGCWVEDLNWVSIADPEPGVQIPCEVKIRYNMRPEPANLEPHADGTVHVRFERPLRAVTPGQAAVFYGTGPLADCVLGGGTINEKESDDGLQG